MPRGEPLELPGKANPKPSPIVDPLTLSRGPLALDGDPAAESMSTLSLSREGTVSKLPPSEGMRAILESEIKGYNPNSTEVRAVIGGDDRIPVTDTIAYPSVSVGWLWMQDQEENWATCTATRIGPRTVLTAAHCVYDHENGGWATDIVFYPGMSDNETAPHGKFNWANVNILEGFIDNYEGYYGSVMPWDLAVVELQEEPPNEVGWMGVRVDEGTDFNATLLSYPGDKPDGTQWQSTCDVGPDQFDAQTFWHDCDMYPGSSGGALWETDAEGKHYVRGINVAESVDGPTNYGLRLTEAYFQFVKENYW